VTTGTRYGGPKSIFQGRDEDKKGEDLRIINDGSEKTGDGLNLYESRIKEPGRATVSST
jgi:hypothetical protein